jgi:pimeloyl-ACP methyl ester carboxylesterase
MTLCHGQPIRKRYAERVLIYYTVLTVLQLRVPLSDYPEHSLYVETHTSDPSLPWVILSNSLLTNIYMWKYLLPYILEHFNVILHDQRGHGQSSTPPSPFTIPLLARDMAAILDYLNIAKVRAVIGVSQGGAATLSFGNQFPDRTELIISCDTGPRTPAGNKEAWQSRIELATKSGMSALADVTAGRWFPAGISKAQRMVDVKEMIANTSMDGFALGAGALQDYDLIKEGLLDSKTKTLLIAGSKDGDGKVAQGMTNLAAQWTEKGGFVRMEVIQDSGHLPMIDNSEAFWLAIEPFLQGSSLKP